VPAVEAGADILTAAQREQFDRDGYFIIEDIGIPNEVLDAAIADMDGLYEEEEFGERTDEHGVFYTSHRIMDAWKISENVKAIATNPRMHAILRELYGREPLAFQTLNFPFGTQQAVHSDTIHFNSKPPGFMAGAWVALEDMDMDNGPVVYYPGSHKLPEITMQTVGVEADYTDYPQYERYIKDLIEREGLEPHYATINKGEAFIWSANILHGGSPQRDPARSRHSQVTHFFFEGCRYYTPMTSPDPDTEEGTFWRDPQWIR
jgi:ectoine hydroxylase-related dioxygenase (phytanoyl-CoA dioxygenase family)